MFTVKNKFSLLLLLTSAVFYASATAGVIVDFEGGVAVSGYNTVRIPGDTGSRFSLTEDFDSKNELYGRVEAALQLGGKHRVSLLAAPLTINANGPAPKDINYNGRSFVKGTNMDITYRFDSYRMRYSFFPALFAGKLGFGCTVKLRDAAIKVEGGGESTEKSNTGFVPLLNFTADIPINNNSSVVVDADALAAPQGRAEDVMIAVKYKPSSRYSFKAGYRMLEGGADNDEVYTFALVNYWLAGIAIYF